MERTWVSESPLSRASKNTILDFTFGAKITSVLHETLHLGFLCYPPSHMALLTYSNYNSRRVRLYAVYLTFFKDSLCFQDRDSEVGCHLDHLCLHSDLGGAVFQKLYSNSHISSRPNDPRGCHQKPRPKRLPTREKYNFLSLHLHSFPILKFNRQ